MIYSGILDFVSHILDDKLYSDPNFNKKIPSIVKQGINTPKQLEIFFDVIKEETDKIVNEWTASTEKVRKMYNFILQLILTLWQLELFHEASKFMLRTAIRIILGEIIYNKYRDDLVEDFRTLEIDGKMFKLSADVASDTNFRFRFRCFNYDYTLFTFR